MNKVVLFMAICFAQLSTANTHEMQMELNASVLKSSVSSNSVGNLMH